MKKEEQFFTLETVYDVILGQNLVLRPRPYIEIKPVKFIGTAKTLDIQRQMQRKNNGQNR